MTEDDYLLAQGSVTVRGNLDLDDLKRTFNYALIQHNPKVKITRVQSLVNNLETAIAVICPRDEPNTHIALDGQVYQQDNCCKFCLNQIDCYIFGITKTFILASKYKSETL